MVNFRDPAKIARDFWTVVKLWHTIDGLFIWEFFTTLDYEWSIIQGRRPYRWTIWIYSLARVAALLSVIVNIIGFDASKPINCQVWITFELVFAYLAFAAALLLVALRTVVLWNRNRIIFMIASSIWWTNFSFLIQGIARGLRGSWVSVQGSCVVSNTENTKATIITMLSSDIVLLVIMLVGFFRQRPQGVNMLGLIQLLWTQGIIWLLLAFVIQVPQLVFIFLNLNDPFNLMFQSPAVIAMTIGATRMYRSITDFGSSDISQDIPQSRVTTDLTRISVGPIPLSRIGVAVHTTSEQYPASHASQYGSYLGTNGQISDKPRGLGIDDDVEISREK